MEHIIKTFSSKRNQIDLMQDGEKLCVRKCFSSQADWERERTVYESLSGSMLPHARLLAVTENTLTLSFLTGFTYTELLQNQGMADSVDLTPWRALVVWLKDFSKQTGLCYIDGNLRNFIFNVENQCAAGIDFESCKPGTAEQSLSRICAHILANRAKRGQKIVEGLLKSCNKQGLDAHSIEETLPEEMRKLQIQRKASAVILAGGKGTRMGRNKAELPIEDTDFLHWQIRKLQTLGIAEIYCSGYAAGECGIVDLPDLIPNKGPLSGIHAALRATHKPTLLVLSVDTPLLKGETLQELLVTHIGGEESSATVLCCDEKIEPLIAAYSSTIADRAENIVKGSRTSVMRLLDEVNWKRFAFTGDERELQNCNTPEDYEACIKK